MVMGVVIIVAAVFQINHYKDFIYKIAVNEACLPSAEAGQIKVFKLGAKSRYFQHAGRYS